MLRIDINLLFNIINLLILYFLLKKFCFGPILAIIDKRKEMVQTELDDARASHIEADTLKKSYEDTLADVETETDQMRAESRKRATEESDKIIQNANTQALQILESAKKNAELEKEQALKGAEAEIATLVMAATSKILGGEVSADGSQKIYNQFKEKTGE